MEKLTAQDLESLSKSDLIAIILKQQEIIENLEYRIACLEKNSGNSSKPPSTDNFTQVKRTRSLRQKSGKRSGGQHGHIGSTHKQTEHPDEVIVLRPEICDHCGLSLVGIESTVCAKRQVVDIPPIIPRYTEYQTSQIICSCGHHNKAQFPVDVTAPIQLGSGIKSMIVYLNSAHQIPYDRLTQITSDLLGLTISQGTIDNILQEMTNKGQSIQSTILTMVKAHHWIGGDETGVKVSGKLWWEWVWQNVTGSFYVISHSRGYQVVEKFFGTDYLGGLVHDCWSAQNNTAAKLGHQLCHVHLIRELWFSVETEVSSWSYNMIRLLQKSQRARDVIWQNSQNTQHNQHSQHHHNQHTQNQNFKTDTIQKYGRELDKLLLLPLEHKTELKLQKRLKKHREKILFFMNSADMPYENNSSERAIRQAKIKLKVSGGFRSSLGAQRYATILTIIETCKKQKLNVLESLQKVILGQPLAFQVTE